MRRLRDTDYANQEEHQKILRDLLDYDPCTGVFTWRFSRPNARQGDVAGRIHECGNVKITCLNRRCYAHYLAWLYVEGRWPKGRVVHINGDTTDNRYANLREVPRAERRRGPIDKM